MRGDVYRRARAKSHVKTHSVARQKLKQILTSKCCSMLLSCRKLHDKFMIKHITIDTSVLYKFGMSGSLVGVPIKTDQTR